MPCILVALDGSPVAEAALGPAQEVARRLGAELILVQAAALPASAAASNVGPYLAAYVADCALADAEHELAEVARHLPAGDRPVHVRAELGPPAQVIARVAQAEHPDLIVVPGWKAG